MFLQQAEPVEFLATDRNCYNCLQQTEPIGIKLLTTDGTQNQQNCLQQTEPVELVTTDKTSRIV